MNQWLSPKRTSPFTPTIASHSLNVCDALPDFAREPVGPEKSQLRFALRFSRRAPPKRSRDTAGSCKRLDPPASVHTFETTSCEPLKLTGTCTMPPAPVTDCAADSWLLKCR